MAKVNENVASLNPEEMMSGGGLKTDFVGTVTEAVYCRWDYNGTQEPALAARLTIELDEPDGDEEPSYTQHWSAGNLESFVPSEDGKNPCAVAEAEDEEDEVGPYALRVGKRAQLNNNTNFAHLMSTILEAGAASKKFTTDELTSGIDCLVGIKAHWDRIPQRKRSGLKDDEGDKKGGRDILAVTEVYSYREEGKGKGKGKAKASTKTKVKEAEADDEDTEVSPLDEKLHEVILEALAEGEIKKTKLAPLVLRALAKDKDKAKAVKRVMEKDFLDEGPWEYDAKAGTLSLGD